jgi:hypothetical protein
LHFVGCLDLSMTKPPDFVLHIQNQFSRGVFVHGALLITYMKVLNVAEKDLIQSRF